MNNHIAIAIDGPAAAGKSTVAKIVAHKLSYIYIDTGAMYRALTYKVLQEDVTLEDECAVGHVLHNTSIELVHGDQDQKILLDGRDVSMEIRGEQVTNHVSIVAKHRNVREEMVNRQRQLAKQRRVVMDGRDIGTHVIPDAEVKIFLIASVQERAERRHKENTVKGFPSNLEKLKEDIRKRDKIDSEREVSPLVKATDAIEIDTTSLSIEEVANEILQVVYDIQGKEE
ncbi:(d)CMP kinase [Pontibacillus litoralis]|uniref:Cytidylate kinase n=1 Tax=Pontibacillus litoralis JSM 072002 TaxID=1385512 RepID=A0A0A5HWI7_9BACI|nr:(d)CMP kinase [Pontibacillus litoralis]KGX87982.1 cytidylate kinase [Pontibacillus litoralis JSM 072002]